MQISLPNKLGGVKPNLGASLGADLNNSRQYNPIVALGDDLLEYWDLVLAPNDLTLVDGKASAWKSGKSSLTPAQSTEASRPIYEHAGLNGGPCLAFDGIATRLNVSGVGSMPTGSEPCEIWIFGGQDAPVTNANPGYFFSYGASSASQSRGQSRSRQTTPLNRNALRGLAGNGSSDQSLIGSADFTGPFVARLRIQVGKVQQWLNGVSDGEIANTLGGTATTRTTIGAWAASSWIQGCLGRIQAIYVTKILSGKDVALQNYGLERVGLNRPIVEPYNPSDWQSQATSDPILYNGINFSNHSARQTWSLATSAVYPNLTRHELREGDEWSGDMGRDPPYDRAEFGAHQQGLINGSNEFWYSFAVRGWGLASPTAAAICQVFSDGPEFMLQQYANRMAFQTFTPDGVNTVRHTTTPLIDGIPEQFVIRFISRDDGNGELEAWRNGVHLFNSTGISYGFDSPTNQKRPKFGIYRHRTGPTMILHMANFRVGNDLRNKIDNPDPLPTEWR